MLDEDPVVLGTKKAQRKKVEEIFKNHISQKMKLAPKMQLFFFLNTPLFFLSPYLS